MSVKSIILAVCGVILVLATILVFRSTFFLFFANISMVHPWDYVIHFLVCFVSIIFFFILIQKFSSDLKSSLVSAIIITLAVSLFKEFVIDPQICIFDLLSNFGGISLALVVLHFEFLD